MAGIKENFNKLDKKRLVVNLIIDVILIVIVYLILTYTDSTNTQTNTLILNTFVGFIFSKHVLHVLYGLISPPKCILDADDRTCRF